MRKTTSGFTLVELLITIVVIAILASISVVAYSGVQHRANAARAAAVVDTYSKLIKMYYVDHQEFPHPGGGSGGVYGYGDWCLGRVSDFEATSGSYNQGDCIYNSNPASAGGGDGHYRVAAYQDFNDALLPYTNGEVPSGELQTVKLGNESWRGVRYTPFYNGQFVRIEWILQGNVEDQCAQANYASDGWWGSTWCTLDIDMR